MCQGTVWNQTKNTNWWTTNCIWACLGLHSKCRNYDCHDFDHAHLTECRQLRRCQPSVDDSSQAAASDDTSRRGAPLVVDSRRLSKTCVKAHCTSNVGTSTTVDYNCAYVLCYRHYPTTEQPAMIPSNDMDQTGTERRSPGINVDTAKRAGFTDTAGACMAFHCGGKSPGTLEFLLCASRNRCAGW